MLNDAYPEARRQLDLGALQLGRFDAGALVADGRRLLRLADPHRDLGGALRGWLGGAVGVSDALRVLRLRHEVVVAHRRGTLDPDLPGLAGERTTAEELAARGFSAAIRESFFRPFFGGVFLEETLTTAAPVFLFDFAMFALGRACLPAGGMQAIPSQLASTLPAKALALRARVVRAAPGEVELEDGEHVRARAVVVAVDRTTATEVLPPAHRDSLGRGRTKSTRLVAFAAERSPLTTPTLVLGGSGGPIGTLTVPSDVAVGYAPSGASLITVSVRSEYEGRGEVVEAIRAQAAGWFGPQTSSWRTLVDVPIASALPDESPEARRTRPRSHRLETGLFVAGDFCTSASIQGALVSGRCAAEAVLAG